MSVPLWVTETADCFWATAGGIEPFPRTLRRAIARSLPLTIVLLPQLSVRAAEWWLRHQNALQEVSVQDRLLRACLVCRFGHGIVFIDGEDPEAEQRFSLAHELAHFLRDYYLPRQRVERRLGQDFLQILDGSRPPHTSERAEALLAGADLIPYVHLMDRLADGRGPVRIDLVESAANRLAFELLAPSEAVMREVEACGLVQHRQAIVALLVERFGLPEGPAYQYSQILVPEVPAQSAFLRHLRRLTSPVELIDANPE